MLWDSWRSAGSTIIVGVAAYAGLVAVLRLSGKRSLSKLNAFDLVVTVALGSTLATTLLSPDVSLVQGLVAFALLAVLQLVVTFLSVRIPPVRRAVKASPSLLVSSGTMIPEAMRRQRVTEDEVLQAVRSSGKQSLGGLDVVLETNGELSVVQRGEGHSDALDGVH